MRIQVDPQVPADPGADFTLAWWMRSEPSANGGDAYSSGAHEDWIYGRTIFDRDVFGTGDCGDFAVSLAGDKLAFGTNRKGRP